MKKLLLLISLIPIMMFSQAVTIKYPPAITKDLAVLIIADWAKSNFNNVEEFNEERAILIQEEEEGQVLVLMKFQKDKAIMDCMVSVIKNGKLQNVNSDNCRNVVRKEVEKSFYGF